MLKYRRLVCGSSETLEFGNKLHYNRQVKFKVSNYFKGRLEVSPRTTEETRNAICRIVRNSRERRTN
jgi:hypothetical protein